MLNPPSSPPPPQQQQPPRTTTNTPLNNPQTPRHKQTGTNLHELITSLNDHFALDLPNPHIYSPSTVDHKHSTKWRCYHGLKRLFYSRNIDLGVVLNSFEEWVCARCFFGGGGGNGGKGVGGGWNGRRAWGKESLGLDGWWYGGWNGGGRGGGVISQQETEERLKYFMKLVDDEIYLLNRGHYSPFSVGTKRLGLMEEVGEEKRLQKEKRLQRQREQQQQLLQQQGSKDITSKLPYKRRFDDEDDDEFDFENEVKLIAEDDDNDSDFHTAPNSPTGQRSPTKSPAKVRVDRDYQPPTHHAMSDLTIAARQTPGHYFFFQPPRPQQPPSPTESLGFCGHRGRESTDTARTRSRTSFSTVTSSYMTNLGSTRLNSFCTDVSDVTESQSTYDDSVAAHMLSQEMYLNFDTKEVLEDEPDDFYKQPTTQNTPEDGGFIEELLRAGPFSLGNPFRSSIPLRYRYELERVGRFWNVSLERMLVGSNISFRSHDEFWDWVAGHSQRGNNPLPEKSSHTAWDYATGNFKTDRHSEVVVLTGSMDWCSESEPGILKLFLNPLKIERTCRFRRRFGSDRFLSLTIPAPSRPPRHLNLGSQPALMRESVAAWLTQNEHRCLGRVWRPFFVEEVKAKRRSKEEELRFRVEFFAVDGVDFNHYHYNSFNPFLPRSATVSPANEESDRHTPMTLESLVDWHMPLAANSGQSNCKLFQRLSLGLSKTFATVSLRPSQVLYLGDIPGRPVMNDGCALMSRGLANAICDSLSISGNTPSCFQGRFAGAKGLWMVDRHHSSVQGMDEDIWLQVSDSQLKINPHPRFCEAFDEEQLTFEVVCWSKPLHPVDLNIQLLGILEHGGQVKERVAELTRNGIRALYQDFADVLQTNSNILCRSMVQKLRPGFETSTAKTTQGRRLEQWVADEAESIIRFTEAGFQPQSFYPLRRRLGKYLKNLLDRHVSELRIEVPLSTYAFCIADPYDVLAEDEVHFGFSNQWRDHGGRFEDNLLDGVDVLVGRLPAHLPSDIQRRRAVWKLELRHFKDVIVFPTRGDVPLAHLLSGGDYDGDTPWICWDQNIVRSFRNSEPPRMPYGPEHFGLTKHSVPMADVQSLDDFFHGTFLFNLTLSNLGRCTVEHEKVAYDESIDSSRAKELACLLSHLVDGRKSGVHLSERAWREYRKKISPGQRQVPAYKNEEGRRYKPTNIIDYLRFEVAEKERQRVLGQLERSFPEGECINNKDEDLIRPWIETRKIATLGNSGTHLLEFLVRPIDELKSKWTAISMQTSTSAYGPAAQEIIQTARTLSPPADGDHPLLHTWRTSGEEWQKLLASYTYWKYPFSSFVVHAFGETLCRIKSASLPSRTVTNDILACYKFSRRMVEQLAARDLLVGVGADDASGWGGGNGSESVNGGDDDDDDDDDGYEGETAVEELLNMGPRQDEMVVPGDWDLF